ncbi:MAG TPA: 3-hydroxyacyl-CoA dehydrogenase NAD-binding domain-containing protein [Pirellulales bacterium]|jgi:3-hydroxyacyl-CoA dehydrogenase/enoyl-CoA hydratase/3-hydroxybutyryl-CoA epimerase/3-hydroxyacyl-CoA dehydrogenase/enoyl-CoA hydratase/3-hydroxybutyryl-CoA epimerase/enoyl-CoA isomerase|nr:3-hydroxyacyl-CoA dehydrogenase NAD-binding domain-containing protein [Pirellulales bacterium]
MPNDAVIRLSFAEPDIAVLTLDDPKKGANVLSQRVLEELSAHLDVLETRQDLAGLIVRSGKPGSFIAGADLREFAASFDMPKSDVTAMCTRGRKLFQRLANCPFVTVAAIDGICVGGGAELAIWCDRRVMADDAKTQFGFPEVKLGLFPGWGGTARSSRIVGLSNAVELVTSGESIDGRAAYKMGLASDVAPAARIQEAAIRLIRAEQKSKQYLTDRRRWSGPIDMNETELGFLGATAYGYLQQQTKGHYPAPLAALEVMLGAATQDIDSACNAEAEGMAALFGSPVNRALINVFFLSDRNKKDTGIDRPNVATRPIKSVAVIGAGIMGQGIAAANLKRDLPVTMTDAVPQALGVGVQKILEEVSYNKQTKGSDPQRAFKYAALLHATTTDAELAHADLVIEAVVENPEVKRQVFARLEPLLRDDAILASNTSTIPITRLAEGLKRPAQFCGIHFFNPVRKMPLVEVIRGQQSSDETIATAVAYAKSIGKSPIVVNDGPGFLVNRLLLPYMNESIELLLEGVEISAIDRAAKNFGMPMGPITLFDVVGLDTAFYAGRVIYDAFPERIVVSPVVPALIKAGRLGQKSGAGFFKYTGGKDRGENDPSLKPLLAPMIRGQQKLSEEQITARLFLPMLLEATRVLTDKIVRDVRDVDLGLIYGLGFPPFKGGLLFWADMLGVAKILEMLKPLESLGQRWKPTPMLEDMAKTGKKFYG